MLFNLKECANVHNSEFSRHRVSWTTGVPSNQSWDSHDVKFCKYHRKVCHTSLNPGAFQCQGALGSYIYLRMNQLNFPVAVRWAASHFLAQFLYSLSPVCLLLLLLFQQPVSHSTKTNCPQLAFPYITECGLGLINTARLFPSITQFVCTFIPSSLHRGENIHHRHICHLSQSCQQCDSQHDKTVVKPHHLWGSKLEIKCYAGAGGNKKSEDIRNSGRKKTLQFLK